ncbi:MAG: methylated-DNA--[protein]-cysteine S-methyltransferase [Mitsuaria chitosanitabida]|jgi:methylated-DNA-[protein]-cysteine S-methyltransferase|uniref:methylated-DNA--[protein]-cysteine S-methyltransferase n=1 Tax=Roseateles chitosanitabidus TaxID=65048 RepID=UPI001B1A249F|nr:methylated-DNA--[protein]-cysteine S-methyltransferase [Roseateles chitosanitabidus]MBO9686300.1 methylated-DNA--[protein]-cysteine S-methyltransferase [Roseateles chitosanitabidus]
MAPQVFFHCYPTVLGHCGIAWTERGIVGSQLPEESASATRDRMRVRFPAGREVTVFEELPGAVRNACTGVRALLEGEPRDLLEIELDDSGLAPFDREVLALTRRIPVGQTLTYGEVATRVGQPGAARAVGRAEGHNPFAPIVPCHRVMGAPSAGKAANLTGFSAAGGVVTKLKILAIEARATGQQAGEQQDLF